MVKQQLDALRDDCHRLNSGYPVPSDATFEKAKLTIEKFRQLADFPALPESEVSIGSNGEVIIMWDFSRGCVELTIADTIHARVYNDDNQEVLELPRVPVVLSFLAKAA